MNDAFESENLPPPPRTETLRVVGLSLEWAIESLLAEGAPADQVARLANAYKESFRARRLRQEVEEPLYPGIRDLVEDLADRSGLALAVATGKSRRGLHAVLEREQFTSYFAALETADTHPSKPHPSMIQEAVAVTGATIDQTVMIGDTTFDMTMARAAGVSALGVTWGYHETSALLDAGAHEVSSTAPDLLAAIKRHLSLPK